jgi:uncharacterized membrane protein YebE (DUF533 family)
MKSRILKMLVLAAMAALSSCASGPNAQMGTVAGAAAGGLIGGVIGHQSGRGLEGAAIGAGIGGVGGNMAGSAADQRNAQYYRPAPQPQYNQNQPYYR